MILSPKTDEWTIVVLGNWNVSIFNPDWLTKNVFNDQQLKIEVPLTYGLPLRIKGDNILFLPSNEKIIIGLTKIEPAQINRLEEITIKILNLLPHTPIYKIGMNFGFETTGTDEGILRHFPLPDMNAFSDNNLLLKKKKIPLQL